ncbi:hypothetical protein H6501_05910 [Candidatus Woesearchaeota archaeon]|nr:hypothetical protein [Candidatus Woesearchaeota archaeon]
MVFVLSQFVACFFPEKELDLREGKFRSSFETKALEIFLEASQDLLSYPSSLRFSNESWRISEAFLLQYGESKGFLPRNVVYKTELGKRSLILEMQNFFLQSQIKTSILNSQAFSTHITLTRRFGIPYSTQIEALGGPSVIYYHPLEVDIF